MIRIGKQVGGKINWTPRILFWGGCAWINFGPRSAMISLPSWFVEGCAILGIDLIGD